MEPLFFFYFLNSIKISFGNYQRNKFYHNFYWQLPIKIFHRYLCLKVGVFFIGVSFAICQFFSSEKK